MLSSTLQAKSQANDSELATTRMMREIITATLDVTVGEDRNLIIHLPDNMPVGRVEVTIRSIEGQSEVKQPLTRDVARAKLLAAGRLSTAWGDKIDIRAPMTEAEVWALGQTVQNARTAQDYIDDERGRY